MEAFWNSLNHFNVLYTTLLVIVSNVAVAFTLRRLQRAEIRETAEDWQAIATARQEWVEELQKRVERVEEREKMQTAELAKQETQKRLLQDLNLQLEQDLATERKEKLRIVRRCALLESEVKRLGGHMPPEES